MYKWGVTMNETISELDFIDQAALLNRQKLPERLFHAKGAGAYGYFRPYMSLKEYTKADFLQSSEKETPVFVRFSTMNGQRGSSDTVRDTRGFCVKFHTKQGDYDFLGSHLPVEFVSEPAAYFSYLESIKPQKESNIVDKGKFWDFIAKTPKSVHKLLWLYSDYGTLKSYRKMAGYSVFPYEWINEEGKKYLVKYYFKPLEGIKNITRQEAEFLSGFDVDAARRDLFETLEDHKTVEYELYIQLLPVNTKAISFNPLDVTCVWTEKEAQKLAVGKLVLQKNCKDYEKEVEQVTFCPGNIVPGIRLSNIPLLRILNFACKDSERYRLGSIRQQEEMVKKLQVEKEEWQVYSTEDYTNINLEASIRRCFMQAGIFFRSLDETMQQRLMDNIMDDLMFLDDSIQQAVVMHLQKVEDALGKKIAKSLTF